MLAGLHLQIMVAGMAVVTVEDAEKKMAVEAVGPVDAVEVDAVAVVEVEVVAVAVAVAVVEVLYLQIMVAGMAVAVVEVDAVVVEPRRSLQVLDQVYEDK